MGNARIYRRNLSGHISKSKLKKMQIMTSILKDMKNKKAAEEKALSGTV